MILPFESNFSSQVSFLVLPKQKLCFTRGQMMVIFKLYAITHGSPPDVCDCINRAYECQISNSSNSG